MVKDNYLTIKSTLEFQFTSPELCNYSYNSLLPELKNRKLKRSTISIITGPGDIVDLRAGGGTTITQGELVKLSGVNIIEGDVVEADIIAGKVVGKSLEGVTIGTAKTIEVML